VSRGPGGVAERAAPSLATGSPVPPARVWDVALLDLDGVVYVGARAVPGAPAALAAARAAGMRLGFVTNNASRTPGEVAAHLTELGVPAGDADVITSSQAAAGVVRARFGPGARVLPVGGAGVAAALAAEGLAVVAGAADAPEAVVQGYGPAVGWAELAEAVVAVRGGAEHVATNTDATIPSPRGPLPGNGALVGVVAAVTGRSPVVTGKPDPAMHAECVRRTRARRPLVVGDRLDTDIEGARRAGAESLLVFTGVTDPALLLGAPPEHRPDLLAPDTSGLLVAHPPVTGAGQVWRCGSWTARTGESPGAVLLTGDAPDGPESDGLDGLRALCVAAWSAAPDRPAAARPVAGDERAAAALERWGLLTG
jgi:glycerol 3-phosphatase-2